MLERSLTEIELAQRAKSGIYERIIAPLMILLVTLASLVVLVFLGSRAMSCANHVSAWMGDSGSQTVVHAGLGE